MFDTAAVSQHAPVCQRCALPTGYDLAMTRDLVHKHSALGCFALIAAFKMSRLIQTVPERHALTHLRKTNQASSGCSSSDLVFIMWSGFMLLVLVWNRRNHPKCDTWTCRVSFLQALECKPSGMQQIDVKETASACPSAYLSGCLPVCIAQLPAEDFATGVLKLRRKHVSQLRPLPNKRWVEVELAFPMQTTTQGWLPNHNYLPQSSEC